MNTTSYLFITLFLVMESLVAAGNLPPTQAKAFQLMQTGHRLSPAEMEVVLGVDREEVLELVRKIARSEVREFVKDDLSRTQLSSAGARWVLLRLPDPDVLDIIGNQLAEYQISTPYGSLLDGLFNEAIDSKQPKLLPYIAKGIFRPGDATTPDVQLGDRWKVNGSSRSLLGLMRLTEAVQEFSPEVRAWARAMQGAHHLSENEKRDVGRAWWKDNERAILAGNYAAVRPGISPAAGMPQPNVPPNPDDAKRVGPPRKPDTQASEPNDASKPGAADIATLPASRFSGWLPWAGAAIILAAAAGWLFLRLRGRKN